MSKQFQRTIEDFTCEHCGQVVQGTGYTNHCPACLWSKHVDINPGDRAEACGGMLEPTDVVYEKKGWVIIHQCQRCREIRRKRVEPEDNFDQVVAISKKASERRMKKV